MVREQDGRWGTAIEVPGLAAVNAGGSAQIFSVKCATAGSCAAGGSYTAASGAQQAFVESEQGGRWGTAIEVPGLAALNTGANPTNGGAGITLSCWAAGGCAAGGGYTDSAGHGQAFVVTEAAGKWGSAIKVPGLAALDTGSDAGIYSVSCTAAGSCAAGGWYTDGASREQAFVVSRP